MARLTNRLRGWRRRSAERQRREMQARRAKTYVARDGRGRLISSH
ncbi:MAG TPA: hypothetical protein VNV44_12485 [Solirubrobacteraceae bacterium]|nr:hypothetical protein [Solirubrobacteraceae bacterium]